MTTTGQTGSVPVTSPDSESVFRDRRTPIFDITLGGQSFRELGYLQTVARVFVEEVEGMMNYAEVVLQNNNMDMADDDLFAPGKVMEIKTGFEDSTYEVRDLFITENPLFRAAHSGVIIIRGYGTSMLAAREGKQRAFSDKTHSQIAQEIAAEYGWDTDIEATPLAYPKIQQAGRTDYELLTDLANLNGFEFYVEQDMLHFHGIREEIIESKFWYLTPDGTNIDNAEFTIESEGKAVTVAVADYDPLEGASFSVEGVPSGQSAVNKKADVTTWESLAAVRKLILVDQGQFLKPDEAQRFVDGLTQTGQYVVRAELETDGDERVHARKIVSVDGVGRFSGNYYVKRVCHTITSGNYRLTMELARAFLTPAIIAGQLIGNQSALDRPRTGGREDVTSQSVSDGSVGA